MLLHTNAVEDLVHNRAIASQCLLDNFLVLCIALKYSQLAIEDVLRNASRKQGSLELVWVAPCQSSTSVAVFERVCKRRLSTAAGSSKDCDSWSSHVVSGNVIRRLYLWQWSQFEGCFALLCR